MSDMLSRDCLEFVLSLLRPLTLFTTHIEKSIRFYYYTNVLHHIFQPTNEILIKACVVVKFLKIC